MTPNDDFARRHGSHEPYWRDVRIAVPGQVVRHEGRLWLFVRDQAITQTSTHEPGHEWEYTPHWKALDDHLWRESPIPRVIPRHWKKRAYDGLLRAQETIEVCYRQSIGYGSSRKWAKGDGERFSRAVQASADASRFLRLTPKEIAVLVKKRKARRLRKLTAHTKESP